MRERHDIIPSYYMAIARGLDNHDVVNVFGSANNYVYPEPDKDMKLISPTGEKGKITVHGLDVGYNETYGEYEIGDTVEGYSRINSMEAETEFNDAVQLIHTSIYSIILPGNGRSADGVFTIPGDKNGFIVSIHSTDNTGIFVREKDSVFKHIGAYSSFYFKVPIKVYPETDIQLRGDFANMQIILINA